jgi:hypothetical protein
VLQVPNDLLPQLLVKCQNEGVKVGWLGSMDQRNTVFRDMTVDKVGFVLSFELVPDEEEEEKVSTVQVGVVGSPLAIVMEWVA